MLDTRIKEATSDQLFAVVAAADRLSDCLAEFPNDWSCCQERLEVLDRALENCPGTTNYWWKHNTSTGKPAMEEDRC